MDRKRKGKRVALLGGAIVLVVIGLIIALYRREIRAWYLLVTRFDRLGPNAQGYLEYRHEQTGIIFVRLPGGTFLMGSPENEFGSRINERPQHEAKVEPFLIAKYGAPGKAWERGKSCRAT